MIGCVHDRGRWFKSLAGIWAACFGRIELLVVGRAAVVEVSLLFEALQGLPL